jgi:hypothetical protein
MSSSGKLPFVFLSLLFSFSFCISTPGFCDEKPIAQLADFSGTVLIQSRGEWGVKPQKNLPLYSRDKVVTRIGIATIIFADGATIDIKNNSNLLIREREKEKGIIKKVKIVERHILLFLGKMFFKTGTGQVQTQFETEKTVIGLRGTAGILSVGPDGEIYIEFTEGEAKFSIGEYVYGVAKDVPANLADKNPIQRASYLAHAAYEKCNEDKAKAFRNEISPDQAEWSCARARELAAQEIITWTTVLIENNPYPETVEWAEQINEEAEVVSEDAQEAQSQAIDSGAIPSEDEGEPPAEEIFELFEEEPIQNSEAASPAGI